EEYNKHIELFNRGSYKQIKSLLKQVEEFYLNMPYPACDMNRNENCSGDFIYNSKNCNNCFTTVESEDCSFVFEGGRNFNSQDLYAVYDCSGLVYQAVNSTGLYNSAFIIESHNCSDSFYLMNCYQTKNSFGCVGTRNAEYCILNKQYNKDDYLTICKKIIEQFKESGTWGDFFPKKLSAFGYNETTAQLYFPLNKDQALSIGAWWEDYEKANKATAKTIKSSELPDHIDQIDLSLSEQTIICEDTNLPFRLSKPEIHLYKKFKLPIPRKHPNQRHLEMLKWRNQPDLYTRTCINCNKETPSSFSPERKEIVYCQDCFFNEVYT
ncbi:MAG: hypothetical protein KDD56_08785, partial [Bdellovibrionales bacterium]|nr:hypothetical protein [Bdellovibrionales bacterium]